MTKEERLELYDDAEKTWGTIPQFDQCIEEMGELIVAINKYKRHKLFSEEFSYDITDNLIEELADVFMCVEQLIHISGEDKVFSMLDKKLGKMKMQLEKYKKIKQEKA